MPYNINYSYDHELKEVAENTFEMSQAAHQSLAEAALSTHPLRQAKLKGQAGSYLKTLRRLEEAEAQFNQALEILKDVPGSENELSPGFILSISLRLRLYDTFRYQNRNDESEKGFLNLLELTSVGSTSQPYRDFTLQHLGKLYFNLHQYDKALQCFEEALILRVAKEDAALIDSTEKAMQATLYAKHEKEFQR